MKAGRQTESPPTPAPPVRVATPVWPATEAPAERLVQRLSRKLGIDAPPIYTGIEAEKRTSSHRTRGLWEADAIWVDRRQVDLDSENGQRLLAHELVHAAQSRRPASDARRAENEAWTLSGELLRGREVRPVEGISAVAAENPKVMVDKNGVVSSVHALPVLEDAEGSRGSVRRADLMMGPQSVRILTGLFNSLWMAPGSRPFPWHMYDVGPPHAFYPYQSVNGIRGSTAAPVVERMPDPGLFIGGVPSPNDVAQGMIGDCYFLAVVMSIANRDPGHILRMMKPDGKGGATVRLHRRGWEWNSCYLGWHWKMVPVDIQVNAELLYEGATRIPNGNGGHFLQGAALYAAPQYHMAQWYAGVVGGFLEVRRKEWWEVARWVPLLEKAFARYAELYGQYGGAAAEQNEGPNGYNVIKGGFSERVLPMLYGEDADTLGENAGDVGVSSVDWSPWQENPISNFAALDRLALLQGRSGTSAPIVTASTSTYKMAQRFPAAVFRAASQPAWWSLPAAERQNVVRAAVDALVYTQLASGSQEEVAKQQMRASAKTAIEPKNAPQLLALGGAGAPGPMGDIVDLLLDLMNAGSDSGTGQRNVYGQHAYSVVGVQLLDRTGVMLPLAGASAAMRMFLYAQMDIDLSTVTLRNPHHTNEPSAFGLLAARRPGDGLSSGFSDGIFTFTVRQFLRNFGAVESGFLPRR